MIQTTKKPHTTKPDNIEEFKDDALSQKGRTKHIVETDWPTKEVVNPPAKKRKIKKIQSSRLP